MDTTQDVLTFNFIRDEPAKTDSFGSHERVARTIASVIRSAQDFKVIGLLGPWGVGKSTVVKLVEIRLEQHTDIETHLFYYDAWLHQNDPPRRAFLETLIHYLVDQKLTTLSDWQERLDQLNRQIEETESTSTPTLTTSGRIIAFSLLLWPLALPFVGHEASDAAFGPNASELDFWAFALGLIGLTLPFLIAVCFYISWRPTKWPFRGLFWQRANWTGHKPPHERESILSLVMNKEVQRQRNRVTRTPDPTTIEFQDIFREIMEKVNAPKRRFLFVIDNLDRLPEADALSMWATIRSFFLGAQETNRVRKTGRLPTVILPIDETAVQRMYSVLHHADAEALAKSFMDKTFDLTFRVNRPVLSDWNTYLAGQMESVFGPAMPQDWPYITSRLYERFFIHAVDPNVTPRTVNTLINDIAALWLQWRDMGLSFASVAYYAIWQRTIDSNILGAVTTPMAPGIADIDPDWQQAIAALHYGTRPADAAQIMIDQPLRKAIAERDVNGFAELTSMPSFDRVLQRQIDQYADTDGIDATPVLSTCFLLGTVSSDGDIWIVHAWRGLRSALRRTAEWRSLGESDVEALNAIVVHCPQGELPKLLQTLDSKVQALNAIAADNPATTAPFVALWHRAKEAADVNGVALPAIHVPGSVETYMRTVAACQDDPALMKQMIGTATDTEIVRELANIISDQSRAVEAEAMFEALLALDRNWVWTPLISAAMTVVRDQDAAQAGVAAGMRILGKLRLTDKTAKAQISTLYDGGQLVGRLNEAYSAQNDLVTARAAALILLTNVNGSLPGSGKWDARFAKSPKLADMLDVALLEFDGTGNLQTLVSAATNQPQWVRIVRAVVSRRVGHGALGPLHLIPIITNLDQYLACVDDSLHSDFITEVAHYESFWDELKEQPFDGNVLTILNVLIGRQDDVGTSAREFLNAQLQELPQERWDETLRSGGEPLDIAAHLAAVNPLQIRNHLFDALQSLVPELLANGDASWRARWFGAASYLRSNAQQIVFKAVRDRIHGGSPVVDLAGLLTTGGAAFLETAGFAEEPDAAVRHIILAQLNDPNGLTWLSDHAVEAKTWIVGADAATREFLAERLGSDADGDDAARQERLHGLRTAWALPGGPTPPANDEEAPIEAEGAS